MGGIIILFNYYLFVSEMKDFNDGTDSSSNIKQEIFDFFKDLAIIIVIVVIIRTFVILPFQISGQSMYDSYYDKEFIIVDRISYLTYDSPKRWDVIVFDTHIDGKQYFIKRIIGLPWETVKINSGSVYVQKVWQSDFIELDEKYLMESNYKSTYVSWDESEHIFKVPEKSYFVMWDNRNASTDGRTCFSYCEEWGKKSNYIVESDIVWRVLLDLWYFSLKNFSFTQGDLWIDSKPRFFSSPSHYTYE